MTRHFLSRPILVVVVIYGLLELSALGALFVAGGRLEDRPFELSRMQKVALPAFAFRDKACFTEERYRDFQSRFPKATVLDALSFSVDQGVICVPLHRVTADVELQLGDAMQELQMHRGSARFSRTLGWDTVPSSRQYKPYPHVATYNSAGIRGLAEYSVHERGDELRIAAMGDSFVNGHDVSDEDVWTHHLAELSGAEVLNFGVGYYGLGQSFLKYRERAKPYQPDIVLIGYHDHNLFRDVNRFRYFHNPDSGFIPTAPRFKLDSDGELNLVPNPCQTAEDYLKIAEEDPEFLRELAAQDYFSSRFFDPSPLDVSPSYRLFRGVFNAAQRRLSEEPVLRGGSYNPDSEAFRLVTRILTEFYSTVLSDGAIPVVVIFPSRRSLELKRRTGEILYGPLLEQLRANDMRYIDLLERFNAPPRLDPDALFSAHYTPVGNEIVARAIHNWLIRDGAFGP